MYSTAQFRQQATSLRDLARETADSRMVELLFKLAAAYEEAATMTQPTQDRNAQPDCPKFGNPT
jgi:hypothetical protein